MMLFPLPTAARFATTLRGRVAQTYRNDLVRTAKTHWHYSRDDESLREKKHTASARFLLRTALARTDQAVEFAASGTTGEGAYSSAFSSAFDGGVDV